MNSERSRLRTFENWPSDAPVDYERIAKAGFYYMGQNLEVQCFSCGGRISEWQYGDMVMTKHRLLDPRCPFVVNPAESGNIPVTETSQEPVVRGTSRILNEVFSESDLNDAIKYQSEEARLRTFNTWPIPSKVDGYRLAKAGFYYLQELDKVRCANCGIDAYNWEVGDDPIVEHRRHSPMCPFLSNLSVGCNAGSSDEIITLREEYCNFESNNGLDATRMRDFGILNHRIPKHEKYLTEESRLVSFDKWPKFEVKNPSELASAGFYYTGVDDKVRCYHCGGGLQKWKANDDPWIEHAKWFPNCDFIFLVKGEEFVNEVKNECWPQENENQQGTSNSSNDSNAIDDKMLQALMTSAPVLSTFSLGLDMSRIKKVIREFLMHNRKGSLSKDELIAAVLDAQFNEPVADLSEECWDDSWMGSSLRDFRRLSRQDSSHTSNANSTIFEENRQSRDGANASSANEANNSFDMMRENSEILSSTTEEFLDADASSEMENENTIPEQLQENMRKTENEEVLDMAISTSKNGLTEESDKNASALAEENRRLKEAKLCKICMDQDVNIVFLPCGHLVSCSICAANMIDCPLCRQIIKGTVRTFLA